MGCVSSKGDINDRHPNVFHVWNVDDMGNVLVPGRIEITETELVLHQRGNREPVRWPMRCLRRYGFETELFSFESGRRCATGAGIYAFRCRRAEALFNLLQEYIQCCGQDDATPGIGTNGAMGGGNQLTGHGNGMAMAAAAAANGGSLRPSSLFASATAATNNNNADANYLEPIVRHRTRSATSREGLAHIATLSLPSNLAMAGGNATNGILSPTANAVPNDYAEQHGYMNDPSSDSATTLPGASTNGQETDRSSMDGSGSLRSPLTPPTAQPWAHEYANTAPTDVEPSDGGGLSNGAAISSVGSATLDVNGESEPHESRRTALYSLLDLRRRRNQPHHHHKTVNSATAVALAAATSTTMAGSGIAAPGVSGGGRRQVVLLRGHSLDDDAASSNYARLDDLLRQEAQQEHALKRHLYMNVVPDGSAAKRRDKATSMVLGQREHFYANVSPSARGDASDECRTAAEAVGPTRNHRHSNSLGGIAGLMQQRSAALQHVNYAVLDLNHRGSSSSGGSGSIGGGVSSSTAANGTSSAAGDTAPTSPTGQSPPVDSTSGGATSTAAAVMSLLAVGSAGRELDKDGYATIDFDKTAALSNTVNPDAAAGSGLTDDEAVRRTRHDANINDVMPQLLMGSGAGRLQPHGGSVVGD